MKAFDNLLPCHERAVFLNARMRAKLIQSLRHLMDVNEDSLGEDYHKGIRLLEDLKQAQKVSGLFYALNYILLKTTARGATPEFLSYYPLLFNIEMPHSVRFFDYKADLVNGEEKINGLIQYHMMHDSEDKEKVWEPPPEEKAPAIQVIQKALALIEKVDKESYQEVSQYISEFMRVGGNCIRTGTNFNLYGLVFYNSNNATQPIYNMADLIIHETSHLYLYSLAVEDPLVLNEIQETYYSEVKRRERPLIGIYHAAFVFIRVIRFLSLLLESDELNAALQKEVEDRLVLYKRLIRDNLTTIKNHAKLTKLGKDIIQSTEDALQDNKLLVH